jgi:succinate dehydrogenase/fumarate reductase flavoprotein subunit
VRDHLHGEGTAAVQARETAALVASARWSYGAASVRTESRGMHQREDRPETDPRLARRLLVGGLERLWTRFEGDAERTWVQP